MKTNTCSGCGETIKARRASATGDHWCQKAQCQAARQRAWRAAKRQAKKVDRQSVTGARFEFFAAAMDPSRRVECPYCQISSAINGYAHPKVVDGVMLEPIQPCFAVGQGGALLGVDWIIVAYPEICGPRPTVDPGPDFSELEVDSEHP